jgi:hypothetical protein
MPTHHPKIYVNPKLANSFGTFISKVVIDLRAEMSRISQAFYQYKILDGELVGVDNLFSVIERTWIGIFNNALVRNSEIAVMQEFNVWNSEKNIGRCDLLFRFKDENEEADIVVEAKSREFFNNLSRLGNVEFYKEILGQAYKYYKEEHNYYTKEVRLMAIIFEWIRNNERLEAAKSVMNNWGDKSDPETDFLTLYYGNTRGVFIYGKIIPVKEYELQ